MNPLVSQVEAKALGLIGLVNVNKLGHIKVTLLNDEASVEITHNGVSVTIPFSIFDSLEPMEILEMVRKERFNDDRTRYSTT